MPLTEVVDNEADDEPERVGMAQLMMAECLFDSGTASITDTEGPPERSAQGH